MNQLCSSLVRTTWPTMMSFVPSSPQVQPH